MRHTIMNNNVHQLKQPEIFKLNRKQLRCIFKYLEIDELSKLRCTCRRLNNAVIAYVDKLQVFVNWDGGLDGEPSLACLESGFEPVIVRHCSPRDFFSPNPPFRSIRQLFLCFEDFQEEPINLTELMQLKYLKIRGANIQLSRNRLPSVTHLDIDDPDNCEKQVFRNLKSFHLEIYIDEFSQLKNVTLSEAIDYAFKKSFDILLDKPSLEQSSFTVAIATMELLPFEKFVDELTTFLRNYRNEIGFGQVSVHFKHTARYKREVYDQKRWNDAWEYLNEKLVENYGNFFQLKVEAFATVARTRRSNAVANH